MDIYLAAIRNPIVVAEPSSVAEALASGAVYLFGPKMGSIYLYEGSVGEPIENSALFTIR